MTSATVKAAEAPAAREVHCANLVNAMEERTAATPSTEPFKPGLRLLSRTARHRRVWPLTKEGVAPGRQALRPLPGLRAWDQRGGGGTFPPFWRACESPMAIACFRLRTFLPLRPLRSVPFLRRRIARRTSFCAALPYRGIGIPPPVHALQRDNSQGMGIPPTAPGPPGARRVPAAYVCRAPLPFRTLHCTRGTGSSSESCPLGEPWLFRCGVARPPW